MDSATLTAIYSNCAKKFTGEACNVTLQELIGNWPIKRGQQRIMFLYVWALSTAMDPNTPLTDNQVLAINARVSNYKYV